MIVHRLIKYTEKKGNYESTEEIINLLYDTYFTNNIFPYFIVDGTKVIHGAVLKEEIQ